MHHAPDLLPPHRNPGDRCTLLRGSEHPGVLLVSHATANGSHDRADEGRTRRLAARLDAVAHEPAGGLNVGGVFDLVHGISPRYQPKIMLYQNGPVYLRTHTARRKRPMNPATIPATMHFSLRFFISVAGEGVEAEATRDEERNAQRAAHHAANKEAEAKPKGGGEDRLNRLARLAVHALDYRSSLDRLNRNRKKVFDRRNPLIHIHLLQFTAHGAFQRLHVAHPLVYIPCVAVLLAIGGDVGRLLAVALPLLLLTPLLRVLCERLLELLDVEVHALEYRSSPRMCIFIIVTGM